MSVFPPYRGGISSFSDALYHELSKKNDIAGYNFRNLYPPIFFPGQTQYDRVKDGNYAPRILHAYNPFIKFGSGELPRASAGDVIIYSYWHPFFAPSLNRALKKMNSESVRICGICHNVIPHESFPFQKSLIRSLASKSNGIVLLSEQTESEFQMLNTNQPCKKLFHPIYEQNDSEIDSAILKKKYGIKADEQVILFFGLVRPYKGLDIFIEALNKINLKKEMIRPLIAGEFYENKKKSLSRIHHQQSDQFIIIDRFISENEMAEVFKISDVAVLPYRTASQSGILSNAINFRVPVIISNLPGLTEHIVHNKHGHILEENSPDCLQAALITMLNSENLNEYRTSLNTLKSELSWKKFVDGLNSFLCSN